MRLEWQICGGGGHNPSEAVRCVQLCDFVSRDRTVALPNGKILMGW
jgi:hypothetical protein